MSKFMVWLRDSDSHFTDAASWVWEIVTFYFALYPIQMTGVMLVLVPSVLIYFKPTRAFGNLLMNNIVSMFFTVVHGITSFLVKVFSVKGWQYLASMLQGLFQRLFPKK